MSMDTQIIRPRLAFEREFGQHRNWWVRGGSGLTGNAVLVLLSLMSHDQGHGLTQTEVSAELGLGQSAWRAAKENLMRHGFLIEIRDRYPQGARRANGQPCGGQKRFRLVLQDPPQGTEMPLDEAIIQSDTPVDLDIKTPGQSHSRKSRVEPPATLENQEWSTKPQVRATLDNQESEPATLDYQESFIGREKDRKDRNSYKNPSIQSIPDTGARKILTGDDSLDEQLAKVHPTLTVANLKSELAGRVDLAEIDVVAAARWILGRAKSSITWAPAYVAKSIVQTPERWRWGVTPFTPSETPQEPMPSTRKLRREREALERAACARGEHDWGPVSWPEFDRAHCLRDSCNVRRRNVDPAFAAAEDAEFESVVSP
ncbi:MAG: hypothetical protein GX862_01845 [Leucobacter sp.]|nr:hypothetical protein [Leucobacter sp.]